MQPSTVAALVPQKCVRVLLLLRLLIHAVNLFRFGYFSVYIEVSYCSFNLHPPND